MLTGFVLLNVTWLDVIGFALGVTDFAFDVLGVTGFALDVTGFALDDTGFALDVLDVAGFALDFTGFALVNVCLLVGMLVLDDLLDVIAVFGTPPHALYAIQIVRIMAIMASLIFF